MTRDGTAWHIQLRLKLGCDQEDHFRIEFGPYFYCFIPFVSIVDCKKSRLDHTILLIYISSLKRGQDI